MYKFRIFRRPLLSSFVVTAAVISATSLASAQGTASPTPTTAASTKTTTAAPAPKAQTTTTAATTTQAVPAAQTEPAVQAGPTDQEREAARLSFEAGTKAYGAADYATAVTEFRKAHEAIPSPHAEYWIAVSLDKGDAAGENKAATVAAYDTFLSNPGASHVGSAQVSESQARATELKKSLPAKVTIVSTPAGASVTLNGQPQEGVTPLTLELPAATYKVGLALEGHESAEMDVVAEGGAALEQQVTLTQTPPPVVAAAPTAAPAAATEPTQKNIVPAAVTLGLGGVGLITGTIFGIMALNSKSDFNDNPTADNADAAERNALIADMSFGVALTLGITGIVLLTASDDDAPQETASNGKKTDFMVAPYASRTGGGASARLTF